MTPAPVRLVLPVPMSVNDWPSHHMELHKAKMAYQGRAWIEAYQQVHPSVKPPECVEVTATLYLCQLRDDDGAKGSMKWPVDALRQKQRGKLRWRNGIAPGCGYFVDDDPGRLRLDVRQERVGKRAEERLEIEIRPTGRAA